MCNYRANGYKNRGDYLKHLAELTDCSLDTVYALAEILGESEDFDGLVTTCEDHNE